MSTISCSAEFRPDDRDRPLVTSPELVDWIDGLPFGARLAAITASQGHQRDPYLVTVGLRAVVGGVAMTNSEARKRNQAAQTPQQPHQQPNAPGVDSGAIGQLTEAEGEILREAMAVDWCAPCAQGTTDIDGCHCSALFEAGVERVAAIVRAHVTAALAEVESRINEQIADLPEHREEWAHGSITALRSIQRVVIDLREGVGR